jgi:hypothetical protein
MAKETRIYEQAHDSLPLHRPGAFQSDDERKYKVQNRAGVTTWEVISETHALEIRGTLARMIKGDWRNIPG